MVLSADFTRKSCNFIAIHINRGPVFGLHSLAFCHQNGMPEWAFHCHLSIAINVQR